MKAEINNENKARFFALYWGQEIVKNLYGLEDQEPNGVGGYSINNSQELSMSYLSLKPLSSISDEDAVIIGVMYGGFIETEDDLQDYKDHVQLALIEDDEEAYAMWDHIGFHVMSKVIDFLRSRGYAVPAFGLSVDEIVDAGWAKLVES